MLSQVFISYKREEIEFAELLESKLKEANFNVWIDRQLRAGTDWREKIDEKIRKSIALIVIMTPAAKESEYVTYEWAFAYGAGVRVIPLVFKSVKLHPRLEALHYRDFSNEAHQPWDELINDLRDAQASQLTIHYAVWGAKNKMDNVTHDIHNQPDFTPILHRLNFASGKKITKSGAWIGTQIQRPRPLSDADVILLNKYARTLQKV
jgi:hypothetical protein